MITVVLADDNPVMREWLRKLLERDPDIQLVGEALDGIEALGLVRALAPNLLVTDLMMPGLDGIELAERVRKHSPATRVLVMSAAATDAAADEAWRRSGAGFLPKHLASAELSNALRVLQQGGRYPTGATCPSAPAEPGPAGHETASGDNN